MKQGTGSLYINTSLKNLLKLFEDDAIMEQLDLGDTLHPFSGYVDASMIFQKDPTVKMFLRHNYDWRGLIVFTCKIGPLKIEKTGDCNKNGLRTVYGFRVDVPFKTLLKLEQLLIERNAYEPGVYRF